MFLALRTPSATAGKMTEKYLGNQMVCLVVYIAKTMYSKRREEKNVETNKKSIVAIVF